MVMYVATDVKSNWCKYQCENTFYFKKLTDNRLYFIKPVYSKPLNGWPKSLSPIYCLMSAFYCFITVSKLMVVWHSVNYILTPSALSHTWIYSIYYEYINKVY